MSVTGDPHVNGSVSNGSATTPINFTTHGGAGETIDMLESSGRDGLQVDAKLQGGGDVTTVGEEHVQAGGTDIDIKPGDVTVNGQQFQDGTYSYGGTTISKQGGTTTITTESGEKLTVTDQGGSLDTNLSLDHYQGRLGGMLGDAINGHSDANAEDYVEGGNQANGGYPGGGPDGGSGPNGGGGLPGRDHGWASGLLGFLGHALESGGFNMLQFARFLQI